MMCSYTRSIVLTLAVLALAGGSTRAQTAGPTPTTPATQNVPRTTPAPAPTPPPAAPAPTTTAPAPAGESRGTEARTAAPDTRSAEREYPRDFMIGAGDVLEIVVWDNAILSRVVPVRPDGRVSLPLVRDVQAAGLTPAQLEELLTKALTGYIQTPVVSVIVREVHSYKVSVLGQVKTPGRYDLAGRVTVLDTLAMAGGLTEFADKSHIVVLRRDGATTWQIPFQYDRLSSGLSMRPQDNFFVQPNDIVLVR